MFIATRLDEMDGGWGKEIRNDRNTWNLTGYDNNGWE